MHVSTTPRRHGLYHHLLARASDPHKHKREVESESESMASRPCTLPLVVVVLVLIALSPLASGRLACELWEAGGGGGRMVGGRRAVEGVESDGEVQELGLFCVAEQNRRGSGHDGDGELLFSRVVAAQTQVVAGIKYYLRIVARYSSGAGDGERVFDAVVVVKAWLPSRVLVSFEPAAVPEEQPGDDDGYP